MSETANQVDLSTFSPSTDDIELTRTIRLKLETSGRKNGLVADGIKAYQQVLSEMADVISSYPEHEWEPRHSHMYHHSKRFLPSDRNYRTTVAQVAQQQVAESFKSWRELGKPGSSPAGNFGDGKYLGLRGQEVEIAKNDKGWGLKASFISHNPVWFHIDHGAFQQQFLERITDPDDDATAGSAELHLHDDGTLYCHQTVSWSVDVYNVEDVNTTIGVDLNDDPLAVAAVVTNGAVEDVHFISGSEFRHYRERLKRKRAEAMADDNLKAIKDARLTYERYTDHVTNTVSRQVVDLAVEHAPAQISLEDLTDYRVTAENPIHDWPYAEIQSKIAGKAEEEGLPVETVNPKNTSVTCRKCGNTNPAMRDGDEFECWDCGYQVHADVNAAINIAQRETN